MINERITYKSYEPRYEARNHIPFFSFTKNTCITLTCSLQFYSRIIFSNSIDLHISYLMANIMEPPLAENLLFECTTIQTFY